MKPEWKYKVVWKNKHRSTSHNQIMCEYFREVHHAFNCFEGMITDYKNVFDYVILFSVRNNRLHKLSGLFLPEKFGGDRQLTIKEE